ncbi:HTTM domain-containing protein [Pontibacter sp. E15-1]|uniref:HTTM domain-containing protein n=1 Tax=Pontibacter sp. E15-1 TaxID=2919918 RepID=UPI001F501FCF|nr:HTTM domain-containing protein [Pontibacter sp. E15-1]MCJ8164568.1 HTTM domain-containing protein [Pontibacter sp. E15-1]
MTHSPFSPSSLKRVREAAGVVQDPSRQVFNFFIGTLALRVFSFVWLFWTVRKFQLLLQRPPELFWQLHQLPRLLMPTLPGEWLFYCIAGLAVALNGYLLVRARNQTLPQALLAVCLLWLNLPQWGYGILSHVNHTFLLAHLFLIFIPVNRASLSLPDHYLSKSIQWYYAGILFTYTLAGLWKIPALLYKLVIASPDMTWLHPDAALSNAFVSFRNYDLAFETTPFFTVFPVFWQASFVLAVYLQSVSVFAAFRQPLRPWIGLFLVLFHVMNMVAFQTFFVVATVVVLCLFIPYDAMFPRLFHQRQNGSVPKPYISLYSSAFDGFRFKILQKHFYLAGLLYFPGVHTLAKTFLRSRN